MKTMSCFFICSFVPAAAENLTLRNAGEDLEADHRDKSRLSTEAADTEHRLQSRPARVTHAEPLVCDGETQRGFRRDKQKPSEV